MSFKFGAIGLKFTITKMQCNVGSLLEQCCCITFNFNFHFRRRVNWSVVSATKFFDSSCLAEMGDWFRFIFHWKKCFLFEIKWMKCLTSSWRWEKNVVTQKLCQWFVSLVVNVFLLVSVVVVLELVCFCFCFCCFFFQQQLNNSEMYERKGLRKSILA